MRLNAEESSFTNDVPVHVVPQLVCLEGLSSSRAQEISRQLSKDPRIHMPHLSQLGNDRAIKENLFPRQGRSRDPRAESLGMVANRRASLVAAATATTRNNNVLSVVLRMHLLCSFSALRDDRFDVERWADYVVLTFDDVMPGRFVMLDQRDSNGNLDVSETGRSEASVARDNDRRYQALDALVRRLPSISVLNLKSDTHPDSEIEQVRNFVLGA